MANAESDLSASGSAFISNYHFPVGMDVERMEYSPSRIERLVRSAGAKQLILTGGDLGYKEVDAYDAEVTGHGTLALKGLRRKPKNNYGTWQYDDTNNPITRDASTGMIMSGSELHLSDLAVYKADSLKINLDKKELETSVKTHKKNEYSVIDVACWAKVLNDATKQSIVKAAESRYSGKYPLEKEFDPAASLYFYYTSVEVLISQNSPSFIGGIACWKALQLAANSYRVWSTGEATYRDCNWTTQLFTEARTDRMIATAAIAQFGGMLFRVAG